jgi:uncharacterized protein involved in exopolysaccharide biosynthesis
MLTKEPHPPPQEPSPPASINAVLWPVYAYQDQELRLQDIHAWLVLHRKLILILVLIGAIGGTTFAFVERPVYRAQTVVSISEENRAGLDLGSLSGRLGDLGGILGLGSLDRDNRSEFIALLTSRSFTEDFITQEKLMPILYARKWDSTRQAWKVKDPKDIPTLFEAYRLFDRRIRFVDESRTSGLVSVAVEWRDRELAARWANLLVSRVNDLARRRAIDEASRSVDYLNKELTHTSELGIRTAIYRLIENQMSKIMVATVRQEYAFKVIDSARPPDEDFFVRPNRPLLITLGTLGGGVLGVAVALIRGALARRRAP